MLMDKTEERIFLAIMGSEPYWSEKEEKDLRETIHENMQTNIGKNKIIRMLLEVIDQLEYLDQCHRDDNDNQIQRPF